MTSKRDLKSQVCAALRFQANLCKGRVFVLDRPHWEDEDLTLTEIVASRLRLELEYYALSIELKETAASSRTHTPRARSSRWRASNAHRCRIAA